MSLFKQEKPMREAFAPLAYDPAYEKPEPDEAETIQGLLDAMRKVRETTFEDTGHAMRSVHVKSHGLLKGELHVLEDLPETLKQGMFAQAGTYPLLMRLSSSPSDMLTDKISTPRGCALKILQVPGARLPGAEGASTQDFVMVNADPAFQVSNLKHFLSTFKPLAATVDKAEGAKVVVSTVLKGIEKAIEAVGGSSSLIKNMGGEPEHHILGETFFTQVPSLFGRYMAKFSLAPVSAELKALTDAPLEIGDNPFALREAVLDFFRRHGGEWELRAQLCTDLSSMPIEDASVLWPESSSPYAAVARIVIPPQQAWSNDRARSMEDGMAFSPWHGIAAHRPIGSINRGRKIAYELSSKFRAQRSGVPMKEPESLDEIA